MANLVKTKSVLSGIALFIIVIIPLLQNSFYLPATIKRWSQLEWNDFIGIGKPFTQYGAAISSKVYLEFDTASNRFVAYAGQNNRRSWVKSSTLDYDAGLRHEQYHFNITEYHSRLLNEQLESNDSITSEDANKLLDKINSKLSVMQTNYDDDTDHSLIREQQDYWEFKIDSLLQAYSDKDGITTDPISGLQVWFPSTPGFYTSINSNNVAYRYFFLDKYGISLGAFAFQVTSENNENMKSSLIEFYHRDSIQIDSINVQWSDSYGEAYIVASDTLNNERFHHKWYSQPNRKYQVSVTYPAIERSEEYEKITNYFIDSFRIVNSDSIWINKQLNYSDIPTSKVTSRENNPDEQVEDITYCFTRYSDGAIFIHDPITDESGDLYLIFDIQKHADSLVRQNLVMINDSDFLHYPVDSANQVLIIPSEILKDHNEIFFGYLTKEDSAKDCYTFYKEPIQYTKGVSSNVEL